MNREFRGKLVGTLLGDSSLHYAKNGNARFQFSHEQKQGDYAKLKAEVICKGLKRQVREPGLYTTTTSYGEVTYYKFSTGHKYMNYLHRILYSNNGKKYFSRKVLNHLTPEGIAWWYMDDGGVSRGPNKDKYGNPRKHISVEMRISTYCSEEEADTIIAYFLEVWGIQAKKRYAKKTDSYYMAFSSKESLKLDDLISPYITPYFQYKLPQYYNPRAQSTLVEKSKGEDIV